MSRERSYIRTTPARLSLLAAVALVSLPAPALAQTTSARDIIDRVDRLMRGESSQGISTMEVVTENWSRAMEMQMWSLGTEHALVRILSPRKDAGTATLKAAGGFDATLRSASDWDLWLKLARLGPPVVMGEVGATYALCIGLIVTAATVKSVVLFSEGDVESFGRTRLTLAQHVRHLLPVRVEAHVGETDIHVQEISAFDDGVGRSDCQESARGPVFGALPLDPNIGDEPRFHPVLPESIEKPPTDLSDSCFSRHDHLVGTAPSLGTRGTH